MNPNLMMVLHRQLDMSVDTSQGRCLFLSSGPGGHGVVSSGAGTSGGNHTRCHRSDDSKKDGGMLQRLRNYIYSVLL